MDDTESYTPPAPIDVPIVIKNGVNWASFYIDHTNLFRIRNRAPMAEFAVLADVLSRLSIDRVAHVEGVILEWRFDLEDVDGVKFVISKYADDARWYRVTF